MNKIERALISVSEKAGIVAFAKALSELGVEILSTGGTASLLRKNSISVTEVSDYTGFPEMMDGRVKTLHPKIHGGILAQRDKDSHLDDMKSQNIPPIDLVVVNLYPFEKTIQKKDCSLEEAIENIDIGGPTMLRAAAKNHDDITVIVDSNDYNPVLKDMTENNGATSKTLRFELAKKVFAHTAQYDGTIATYLSRIMKEAEDEKFGNYYGTSWIKRQDMRYGENPHQAAAFYSEPEPQEGTVTAAKQLQGKPLSFNNIADSDAALECVKAFEQPACVIVKHANPCGVSMANDIGQAYERAFATDPTSAFGGIVAFNRPLDETTANTIIERQFVEVIIAPVVEDAVLKVISTKPNVRVLATGAWAAAVSGGLDYKRVVGGLLVQERDTGYLTRDQLKTVSMREPTQQELEDLLFSWNVVKFVKSNAIVYCKEGQTIGIGAGQMSRVYSARIAAIKAQDEGLQVKGSVMASDAFFPFRDGIDHAAEAGVSAIIQPGGSKRDDEVIAAADEHGMAMVFTGMRHFRH